MAGTKSKTESSTARRGSRLPLERVCLPTGAKNPLPVYLFSPPSARLTHHLCVPRAVNLLGVQSRVGPVVLTLWGGSQSNRQVNTSFRLRRTELTSECLGKARLELERVGR